MASHFRHSSASVSTPSQSSSLFADIPVPSFFLPTSSQATWLYTTLAIVAALFILEQSVYRYKKRHLPGATWTIPIIGKFADSMKPTMEGYMAQWNSGALSAVSVFNMRVVSLILPRIFIDTTSLLASSSSPPQTSTRAR